LIDILGLDTLFAELVTGLGLALLAGNVFAWWQHRRGRRPRGAQGEFRSGRVLFLLVIGVLMTAWGLASIIAGEDLGAALAYSLW
jgi:hypothetical protein